jgi:hypothetical protein
MHRLRLLHNHHYLASEVPARLNGRPVAGVLACLGLVCAYAAPLGAEASAQALQLAVRVNQAEAQRTVHVGEITSTRRYVLRNRRWTEPAVLHARMISAPGRPKRFEVVSMENAGGLQKRVFQQVLQGEVDLSAKQLAQGGGESDTSISPSNYDFAFLRSDILDGRECAVLQMIPKRKNKYLIKGIVWIDTEAAAVVRVEGQTAASVSFWIGKPAVIQQFRKFEGLWLPWSNRTVSNVRFLGDTEMTIEYLTYAIAREPRVDTHARSGAFAPRR